MTDTQKLIERLWAAGASPIWLARPAISDMIDELSGTTELTHERVDSLGSVRARENLRAWLVAAGILGQRDERLAQFDRWAEQRLGQLADTEDRQVILAYVRWHQRPRLASWSEENRLNELHVAHARRHVNAAITYLAELRAEGRSLADLTQADIDRLFGDRPTYAVSVRDLLWWATHSGRCRAFHLPCYRSRRRAPLDEHRRIDLIRQLLDNDDVCLSDRVGGLLVLSLAQSVARISRLRAEDIITTNGEVTIRLAKTPAPLPAPLGQLVGRLARQRAEEAGTPSCWLFPGRLPGRHIESRTLGSRLRRVDVTCAGRRAALLALAREVPAPVLIDVLGYSRSFVDVLLTELRVDWRAYAALKARETRAS